VLVKGSDAVDRFLAWRLPAAAETSGEDPKADDDGGQDGQ
jgi:hypothetical protein